MYTAKKPLWEIESSNEPASQFKRSRFYFELYTEVIDDIIFTVKRKAVIADIQATTAHK